MSVALECSQLSKRYGEGDLAERVLADVSLSFPCGEACLLLGPSGSGKTTLLSILGCMLSPSSGELRVGGDRVDFRSPRALGELRRTRLGFVFQQAQLLPFLSVEENLRVTGCNAGLEKAALADRLDTLLEQLDMTAQRGKKSGQLSGGQRQRAAIARAVLHRPPILLADEPTAALDWHHGEAVVDMLVTQAHQEGCALIVVTHDTRLLPRFDRVLTIENGEVRETTTHGHAQQSQPHP